uniref:Uncharacterized protein n=1 Tax=Panagrolaimus sp. ES5 TaxID=591445 RepID=A0AC34G9X3_9BILA
MKPRFTGAAAIARIEAQIQAKLQESLPPPIPIPPPPVLKFRSKTDETLYYLKEKVNKALIHHTACKTISLTLQEIHKVNISEIMKQCNVQTPIELYKLMGFDFDENGCFSVYPESAVTSDSSDFLISFTSLSSSNTSSRT